MSDTEHTEDLGKRMHKSTEKSLVSFQSKCLKYQQQIEKLWNTVEDTILSIALSNKWVIALCLEFFFVVNAHVPDSLLHFRGLPAVTNVNNACHEISEVLLYLQ